MMMGRQASEASLSALDIFTTRIDTIFGATFVLLAPEHPFVHTHHGIQS